MQKDGLASIKRYWTDQARSHGQQPSASWSDTPAIELEVRELLHYIQDGDSVLDVGCANGFTTVQLLTKRNIKILGLDYIPEMIQQARERMAMLEPRHKERIRFEVGNIMNLPESLGIFDALVVVRVLINLERWENQRLALEQCARRLRSGGLLLLSEATLQGWERLNCFRAEWGLPGIPAPSFNTYLDQEQLLEAASRDFDLVNISNFASTYFVGTRVLKPLLDEALGGRVSVASPNMEWNRWFAALPPVGDYGAQKLFILRRR